MCVGSCRPMGVVPQPGSLEPRPRSVVPSSVAASTAPTGVGSHIHLSVPPEQLRALVREVLAASDLVPGWPAGAVSLNEGEAAKSVGVPAHVLRDARLRLRLPHSKVGRTVVYTAEQLSHALGRMERPSRERS